MEAEYSKRVYQGVRVKHTVKDLLAEKRSRQTSGPRYSGGSAPPSSFVQVPGSHVLPSYYGVRRPFIPDSDFSAKQFSPDVYAGALAGKPLSCESAAVGGFPPLLDGYYPDAFADYRGAAAAAFSAPGGSFPLSSLLPGYGGDSSHLFLRDPWEQAVPEAEPQAEPLCPDGLASVPPPMASPDPPGSPSQYRSPSRGQPYALHPLEDAHYHPLTPGTSSYPLPPTSFPCSPYMSGPIGELASKMEAAAEASEGPVGLSADGEGAPCWPKEDGISSWPHYELRRPF